MIDEKSTSFSYTMSGTRYADWKPKGWLTKIEYVQEIEPFVSTEQLIISDIRGLYHKAQAKYIDIILGKLGVNDIDNERIFLIHRSSAVWITDYIRFGYAHESGETTFLMETLLKVGCSNAGFNVEILVTSPHLTDEERNTVWNSLIENAAP